jgi:hypothetical protein
MTMMANAIGSGTKDLLREQYNSAQTADQMAASVTRDQWQHFLDTYRPVEDEVLSSVMRTDFSREGDEAGKTAGQSVAAAAGMAARNLRRSGSKLTQEERGALNRRKDLSLTKAVSRAENTTRRTLSDSRTNMLANLVSIGRGVSQTASSGLQSAADIEAQRNAFNMNSRAQATSTNMSLAGTAMAMLIFASDDQLKDNVRLVDEVDGINIYAWTWNEKAEEFGLEGEARGVLASEHPEHVVVSPEGYKQVNYISLFEEHRRG